MVQLDSIRLTKIHSNSGEVRAVIKLLRLNLDTVLLDLVLGLIAFCLIFFLLSVGLVFALLTTTTALASFGLVPGPERKQGPGERIVLLVNVRLRVAADDGCRELSTLLRARHSGTLTLRSHSK